MLLTRILTTPQDCFYGMCNSITSLEGYCDFEIVEKVFAKEDANSLRQYLRDNKPRSIKTCFWWVMGLKEPRIEWLEKQIKIETKS